MNFRILIVLLGLLLVGCSAGGRTVGGTAAPAPGPASNRTLSLRLLLPEAQPKARGVINSVEVEVVEPNTSDPASLSGRVVVARGHAEVPAGVGSVTAEVRDIPPGTWNLYAFGRDAEGNLIAHGGPEAINIAALALELSLQLVSDDESLLSLTPLLPQTPIGGRVQFQLTDSSGADLTGLINWSSSNAGVATIDSAGVATALAAGQTTITGRVGTRATATTLTVLDDTVTLTRISLTPENANLPAGFSQQFLAQGQLSNGAVQDLTASVTWTSSDGSLATINAAGQATGLVPGTVTIMASFDGVSGATTLNVTPALLQRLVLNPPGPFTLSSCRTRQLAAVGTFSDGQVLDLSSQVAWSSDLPDTTTVDNTGLATAGRTGTAHVKAALAGQEASATFNAISGIELRGVRDLVGSANGQITTAQGDFNGDGLADAVTGDVGGELRIYLSNGGRLLLSQTLTGAVNVEQVQAADLDGDGDPDLVSLDPGSQNLFFALNTGGGTFGAVNGPVVTGATFPKRFAVGDFNADGRDDVALSNTGNIPGPGNDTVLIFLSGGILSAPANFTVSVGDGPFGIAAGNLDGDSNLDLAVAHINSGTVQILKGVGNGNFLGFTPTADPTGPPTDVALADLDNDGDLDAAVTNPLDIGIFPNTGGSLFGLPSQVATSDRPDGIAAGDFDQDGNQDLVSTINLSGVLGYFPGNGDLTFGAQESRTVFNIGSNLFYCSPSVADFDGNGFLDALAATPNFYGLFFSTLDAARLLFTNPQSTNGIGVFAADCAVADLNGDGLQDRVWVDQVSAFLTVQLQTAPGVFADAPGSPLTTGADPVQVRVGDLNLDGIPDLVYLNATDVNVSVRLGNGDGTFGAANNTGTVFSSFVLALGDMNGDGRPDVVAANSGNIVLVFISNSDGTLQAPLTLAANTGSAAGLALADFDGDGDLDAAETADNLVILLNDGAGHLSLNATIIPPVNVLAQVSAGDINGDGFVDLVTGSGDLYPYLNTGNGTFVLGSTLVGIGDIPLKILLTDLDCDHRLDLSVGWQSLGAHSIYTGQGDGTFSLLDTFDTPGFSQAVGDLNDDDRPDILVVGFRSMEMLQEVLFP